MGFIWWSELKKNYDDEEEVGLIEKLIKRFKRLFR